MSAQHSPHSTDPLSTKAAEKPASPPNQLPAESQSEDGLPATDGVSVDLPAISDVSDRMASTLALDEALSRLRYVSGARQAALEHLGLYTIRDVLCAIPYRYLDFSHTVPIAYADLGMTVTIVGTVDKVTAKRIRRARSSFLSIVEVSVLDETGIVMAVFFKQPWVAEQIKKGDRIALSGTVSFAYGFKQIKSPFYEVLSSDESAANYSRILPVHHVSEGISVAWMRRIVSAALADYGDVFDYLPAHLRVEHSLMSLARAFREIHFPQYMATAPSARRRFAYDELLCLQITLAARQALSTSVGTVCTHTINGAYQQATLAVLPFALSDGQQQAVHDILADMASSRPMNRLLLGDVGTGKTAVATVAVSCVADTHTQAAIMAPTAVLAQQYATKIGPLLTKAHISWACLVSTTVPEERYRILEGLASGAISVVFGTTALLSDDVVFKTLSLVIIDEQHRFGVDQRSALRAKSAMAGLTADCLCMTATPIPRTLALSLYGDMDVSRIKKRPVAGAGVTTTVLAQENFDLALDAIRQAIDASRQAYVVCPRIDESDDEGLDMADDTPATDKPMNYLHAATSIYAKFSETLFATKRVGLLTGRMSAAEKDQVMEAFRAGELDILVSTTVIEVGVDVPNATVLLVYDADRFGLATLHQLRGRVGRGSVSGQVYFVTTSKKGTPARKRLAALEATSDGFELSEMDLRMRHEGEILGFKQSGGVTLRYVDLAQDEDLAFAARLDARDLLASDPTLEAHEALALEARRRFGAYFEERGEVCQ